MEIKKPLAAHSAQALTVIFVPAYRRSDLCGRGLGPYIRHA